MKYGGLKVSEAWRLKELESENAKLKRLLADAMLDQAKALDKGKYSPEAISILDKAQQLDPKHPETIALRKKIESYTSEIRIPEDAATIAEALPKLRAGDTLILAKGTYKAPQVLTKPIIIKGAGREQTIIKCDTTKHSAITFHGGEKPYSLSKLTIKGTTYQDFNIDRHPLILVEADVVIDDILLEMSSGHGIAVISGSLKLSNSEITANAWDGVSIKGEGAKADIIKCKIHSNYDHGIDFWENATGSVSESEVYDNTGSGIVVMGNKATAKIVQVRAYKNQQCGIVAMDKASVDMARVVTASNVMSGVVVQGESTQATCAMVISNNNLEAGFYLDPKSTLKGFESTTSEGNKRGNTLRKALEYAIERKDVE